MSFLRNNRIGSSKRAKKLMFGEHLEDRRLMARDLAFAPAEIARSTDTQPIVQQVIAPQLSLTDEGELVRESGGKTNVGPIELDKHLVDFDALPKNLGQGSTEDRERDSKGDKQDELSDSISTSGSSGANNPSVAVNSEDRFSNVSKYPAKMNPDDLISPFHVNVVLKEPGHLAVWGTNGDDQLKLQLKPGQPWLLQVVSGSEEQDPNTPFLPPSPEVFEVPVVDIERIDVYGRLGDDIMFVNDEFQPVGNGRPILIRGNGGDDVIFGGVTNDAIYGDRGNDLIFGSEGMDYLQGGDGNDVILGGIGDDNLAGNYGNDRISGGNCWSDTNTVTNLGSTNVSSKMFAAFEYVRKFSNFASECKASSGDDILSGGDGNDHLRGFDGKDQLNGHGGRDTLEGGIGDDQIRGFGGNDELDGGDGADTIRGDSGNDVIRGGEGNDEIHAGDGNDIAIGGNGSDEIHGDAGRDFIDGGQGSDRITGGYGNDVLFGCIEKYSSLPLNDGDVAIPCRGQNKSLVGLDAYHRPTGDGGHDDVDLIEGNAGDDYLSGGFDNDVLSGGIGNDWIKGDDGDDRLDGGDGNDLMAGGLDRDHLRGGDGNDRLYAYAVGMSSNDTRTWVTYKEVMGPYGKVGTGVMIPVSGIDSDGNINHIASQNLLEGGAGPARIFRQTGLARKSWF